MPESDGVQAGESGRHRVQRADARAADLRSEAQRLLDKAAAVEASSSRIAKGNEGEYAIGKLLDELVIEGWVVLHDRRKSPRSPANLDHIVVGPMGVCVIDSKNWTGGRIRLDDRGMALRKWRKDDELHTAKVDAEIVASSLTGVTPPIRTCGVLAFVQDMAIEAPVFHHQVIVLQKEQLLPWLRGLPAYLSAEAVQHVGMLLDAAHPSRSGAVPMPRVANASVARAPAWAPSAPSAKQRKQARQRVKIDRELSVLKKKLLVLVVALLCLPAVPPAMNWATEHLSNYLSDVVTPEPTPSPTTPARQPRPTATR